MDPSKVLAGPAGHWYAWYDGELVAHPISADGGVFDIDHPPQHPAVTPELDGWYAPEDLQGEPRVAVLVGLGVREEG